MLYGFAELQLMFKLMDRVPDGIAPMLKDLEDHIVNAGLADMVASADVITQVFYINKYYLFIFMIIIIHLGKFPMCITVHCLELKKDFE